MASINTKNLKLESVKNLVKMKDALYYVNKDSRIFQWFALFFCVVIKTPSTSFTMFIKVKHYLLVVTKVAKMGRFSIEKTSIR